ncbi:MAG: FG-GAP repeat domain-containing protein [Thermoanaerobaculia bacterium]
MNGATRIGTITLPTVAPTVIIAGVGDLNGDGSADIVWRNTVTGDNSVWYITASGWNGAGATLPAVVNPSLRVISVADLNGDGKADILWRNMTTGDVYTWLMNGGTIIGGSSLGAISLSVTLLGTGDFNGDGTYDLLWRNPSTGDTSIWFITNGAFAGGGINFGSIPGPVNIVAAGDFNGNGTSDLLWRNESTGANSIWFISSSGFTSGANLPNVAGSTMKIVSPPPG